MVLPLSLHTTLPSLFHSLSCDTRSQCLRSGHLPDAAAAAATKKTKQARVLPDCCPTTTQIYYELTGRREVIYQKREYEYATGSWSV